jgi:fatty-acyl-CoA synthase
MVLDRSISTSDVLQATARAMPQRTAIVDEAGSLTYLEFDATVDRLAMIISGGESVYCAEVELALIEHPLILDVAVVGAPDEKWGEIVVAAIVKAADAVVDLDEIAKSCSSLASYKRPREVICFETLPRNSFGKVRKDLVRAMVREQLELSRRTRRAS